MIMGVRRRLLVRKSRLRVSERGDVGRWIGFYRWCRKCIEVGGVGFGMFLGS